jgi:hypothetical protein
MGPCSSAGACPPITLLYSAAFSIMKRIINSEPEVFMSTMKQLKAFPF